MGTSRRQPCKIAPSPPAPACPAADSAAPPSRSAAPPAASRRVVRFTQKHKIFNLQSPLAAYTTLTLFTQPTCVLAASSWLISCCWAASCAATCQGTKQGEKPSAGQLRDVLAATRSPDHQLAQPADLPQEHTAQQPPQHACAAMASCAFLAASRTAASWPSASERAMAVASVFSRRASASCRWREDRDALCWRVQAGLVRCAVLAILASRI